jgi:hypothetical protein
MWHPEFGERTVLTGSLHIADTVDADERNREWLSSSFQLRAFFAPQSAVRCERVAREPPDVPNELIAVSVLKKPHVPPPRTAPRQIPAWTGTGMPQRGDEKAVT